MKKKLGLFIILLAVFLVFINAPAFTASSHEAIFVVGQNIYSCDAQIETMDAPPFIEQDRVYVPVRYLARAIGVVEDAISWNEPEKTIKLVHAGRTVVMAVGNNNIYIDGKSSGIDSAPLLRNGRAYLPARHVAGVFGYEVGWDAERQAVLIGLPGHLPTVPDSLASAIAENLPLVGTYEKLQELLENANAYQSYRRENMVTLDSANGAGGSAAPQAAMKSAESDSMDEGDYSRTNVQVEGVDEADVVKTDGKYIYQVNNQRVIIVRAYPSTEMNIVDVLDFSRQNFFPRELYVDESYLVVIGTSTGDRNVIMRDESPMIYPPYYRPNTTRAIIYDAREKAGIKKLREVELDGSYVSSRKIGSALYLITRKDFGYYPMWREDGDILPCYRDTAVKEDFVTIDCGQIRYFPDFIDSNFTLIAGLDLARPDTESKIYTYLGAGENIYASEKNLYVALSVYPPYTDKPIGILSKTLNSLSNNRTTRVYKFALDNGQVAYCSKGEVPGTVLNQFSMDEYNNCFRIATTTGDIWRRDEGTSKNNVYILDSDLSVLGKIENIAPGEKIYSARFIGSRGYLVTFKKVDPFFVLDLADPSSPKILGVLKIPGYSDYLHPYDQDHIIGFGKDTVETAIKNPDGSQAETMAFYKGMKMAIFDVSDVHNPVEMFTEKIGDRGTDSELLRNHKALLFDKEKKLLAFPVTVMEQKEKADSTGTGAFPEYGQFSFQGAYVYNIDLQSGFTLKGKITHLSGEDYLKAGDYWYDSNKNVERIIYINETLYTLSREYIQANQLSDLSLIKKLFLGK
jgi:inhibitor of cysteine peptidase